MARRDKSKYNFMEPVLNNINGQFIAMSKKEVRTCKKILKKVVDVVVFKLQENNPLFDAMFSRVFYGGSFYDNLRVAKPEEFDLDLLMLLPELAEPELLDSNMPGFSQLRLNNYDGLLRQQHAIHPGYRDLITLLDKKHFLDGEKVRSWMKSIMTSTLNEFRKRNGRCIIKANGESFEAFFSESAPAWTLKLESTQSDRKIDIDFVPCFEFVDERWPKKGFTANPIPSKPNYFLVPKSPKRKNVNGIRTRYWRMSFQEQERILICNKQKLKPAIRLLKKMRDTLQHDAIASYYIKTVALWMVYERKNDGIWENSSMSYIFMKVLKTYQKFLEQREIPYFWCKKSNLVGELDPATLDNFSQRLKAIITDVERNRSKPTTIAKYLLDEDEYNRFMHAG